MTRTKSSVRQRRVSAELRALRLARGVTCADVGRAIGCSESKISRMETGNHGLYVDEVSAILGFLQAPADLRRELLALTRSGRVRNWQGVGRPWRDFIEFESRAVALHNYEPLLIPGLAQTADYARAIIAGCDPRLSATELDELVATRMARQVLLGHARVHLLIEEMTLRRTLGNPPMMRDHLRHLVGLADRPNLVVQVVPFGAPSHPGLGGSFLRMEFADQPSLVYNEGFRTCAFLEEAAHLEDARTAWDRLRRLALSPEESVGLIAKCARDDMAQERLVRRAL